MPIEVYAALVVFCIATLFTPGPNNLMLMMSGLNFGFRRTLPHLFGVSLGFALMVLLVGLGLAGVFKTHPQLFLALKYIGAAYMVWLAWLIARSGPARSGETAGRPLGFLGAAAFQWVNPKAWMMAVTANATYVAGDRFLVGVLLVAGTFGLLGILSSVTWTGFGVGMQRLLGSGRAVRIFNIAMALFLVASLWPVISDVRLR